MIKLSLVILVVNQKNVELLFDCFDQSATLLYEKTKLPYLEGIVKTCENILADSANESSEELNRELEKIISAISQVEFDKEEIRKAFQFACLKGLKHKNISNQMITPESIGLFFSYLVEKLYERKDLVVYDPLVGSGNLITSMANNLEKSLTLIGVDKDLVFSRLTQALFGMLNYGEDVYFQDALTFSNIKADLIVTDFSGLSQTDVFQLIKYNKELLKGNSFLISVIDNSFFDSSLLKEFIYEVKNDWHFFGMLVLPETFFKNDKKSIFILQRIGKDFIKPNKFLMADLPDFNNQSETEEVIGQINEWFKQIEFKKVR
jgi:site-specific DNA-methyltransferase (adenine-specific)